MIVDALVRGVVGGVLGAAIVLCLMVVTRGLWSSRRRKGIGSQPVTTRPSVVRDMGADRRCVVWIDGAYRDNEGVERTMLGAYLRDCNVSFSDPQITELMTLPSRTEAWERRQWAAGGAS